MGRGALAVIPCGYKKPGASENPGAKLTRIYRMARIRTSCKYHILCILSILVDYYRTYALEDHHSLQVNHLAQALMNKDTKGGQYNNQMQALYFLYPFHPC
jgi:hypothetical protein